MLNPFKNRRRRKPRPNQDAATYPNLRPRLPGLTGLL
jgi:hypothetical protein